jgi:acetyltransferase-like isoleucine patch superfamily enzyme
MAINVIDTGSNNRIEIHPETNARSSGTITVKGNDNCILIGAGCLFREAVFRVGDNCTIKIMSGGLLNKMDIYCVSSASITVGARISCTWYTRLYAHEPASITIGSDCLIASDVLISASDMHSIFDVKTGERINNAESIVIGNHVWLAANVSIMKGAVVGSDSVVGAGSIVTGQIPSNCVVAGVPARVIRTGTNWRHDLI